MIFIFNPYFNTDHFNLKVYLTLNLELSLTFRINFYFYFFLAFLPHIPWKMHYKESQKIKFRATIKFQDTQLFKKPYWCIYKMQNKKYYL